MGRLALKSCLSCKKSKPLDEFGKDKRMLAGRKNTCKSCLNKYMREWLAANPERVAKNSKRFTEWRRSFKVKVFSYYGEICACCGETEPAFLTLDHVYNDGAEHRRQLGATGRGRDNDTTYQIYRSLVRTNFANADRYQLLCFNCNCGRQINGGVCPHQAKKLREAI